MSECGKCGATKWTHHPGEGCEYELYCHRCDPKPTTVLPLDVGSEFDIDESEVIHGMPAPVNNALAATGPMPGQQMGDDDDDSDDVDYVASFDDLPEDAAAGNMYYCRDDDVAYVFDGTEWQNLGSALQKFKPNKDAKCDRRAAIKATKAKNNAE
jgi:hypothetical protein